LHNISGRTQAKSKSSRAEDQPLKLNLRGNASPEGYGSLGSPQEQDTKIQKTNDGKINIKDPKSVSIGGASKSQGHIPTDATIGSPLSKSISVGAPSLRLPGPAIPSSIISEGPYNGELIEHDTRIDKFNINAKDHQQSEIPANISIRRAFSSPFIQPKRPDGFLRRVFSKSKNPSTPALELPLEAYREFDTRRADFFTFLDEQLNMIEEFYRMKENEAVDRFEVLKEQLRMLKEHQTSRADIAIEERRKKKFKLSLNTESHERTETRETGFDHFKQTLRNYLPFKPILDLQEETKDKRTEKKKGSNLQIGGERDYSRQRFEDVPYKEAKAKLKHALQDYYRVLDMLKSYAALNREAFRKIIKKYDKTVQTRQTGKYMSEKVDKVWFVKSDVLENIMSTVEDLYARYFEKGSHKIAANKLRVKQHRDFTPSAFRNGLLLGAGTVLGTRGIAYSSGLYYTSNETISLEVSYLLQVSWLFFPLFYHHHKK
jgi:xenotropic and polytropic retrovirus receptor 1